MKQREEKETLSNKQDKRPHAILFLFFSFLRKTIISHHIISQNTPSQNTPSTPNSQSVSHSVIQYPISISISIINPIKIPIPIPLTPFRSCLSPYSPLATNLPNFYIKISISHQGHMLVHIYIQHLFYIPPLSLLSFRFAHLFPRRG